MNRWTRLAGWVILGGALAHVAHGDTVTNLTVEGVIQQTGNSATGANAVAVGTNTVADGQNAFAGGFSTMVRAQDSNAFIFAAGSGLDSNQMRQTKYSDTAHFERLHVFSPANDDSNSVLARWENDARYMQPIYSTLGAASFYSSSTALVNQLSATGFVFIGVGTFRGGSQIQFYDSQMGNQSDSNSADAYLYTPRLTVRQDSDSPLLNQTQAALVLYNDSSVSNSWVKLALAGRETSAGSPISLAGIAAQETDSHVWQWGVGDLVLWTKNWWSENENMRICGATGFVGIGTNSPKAKLHVAGSAQIDGPTLIKELVPQGDIDMGSFTSRP